MKWGSFRIASQLLDPMEKQAFELLRKFSYLMLEQGTLVR